ncbi:MAG: hypothetical protein IPF99_35630, partial [Deltaproteobacteria bacterium]|nr:hypothetical protein [Deltaproteobacteria bacterium]
MCAGLCVSVQTDNSHCGACGAVCAGGTRCAGGACQCPTGQGLCAGLCRDLSADNGNCGGVRARLRGGHGVLRGVCTSTCAAARRPARACAATSPATPRTAWRAGVRAPS